MIFDTILFDVLVLISIAYGCYKLCNYLSIHCAKHRSTNVIVTSPLKKKSLPEPNEENCDPPSYNEVLKF